jgi:type I restriction enzyme, S subunit
LKANSLLLEGRELCRVRREPSKPSQEIPEASWEIIHTLLYRLASQAAGARALTGRLDQAILAKAFRGELVPQDPADEPAGVLLDRIRAARSQSALNPAPARGRRPGP